MKVNKQIATLICELEYLVGMECYNPNSYDGWTGDYGCAYRYPVHTSFSDDGKCTYKIKYKITDFVMNIDQRTVDTMKYKFGSNHLFIGKGIENILNALEERYGLDFEKLESERQEREQLVN